MFKYIILILLISNSVFGFTFKEQREDPKRSDKSNSKKYSPENLVINSFEEALEEFTIAINEGAYDHSASLMSDPMSIKNCLFGYKFKIIQVIDKNTLLLSIGIGQGELKIFYAEIDNRFKGARDFIDDQVVSVIGVIIGVKEYRTYLKIKKTVPAIVIIAIK